MDQLSEKEDGDSSLVDKLAIKEVLMKIPERDRQVILMRFFQDKTQAEVASVLGISQVQVSRIERY